MTRSTRLVLVRGAERGHVTRKWRRDDCALLRACEYEFIDVHGSAQGRCPKTCRAFVPRATKPVT